MRALLRGQARAAAADASAECGICMGAPADSARGLFGVLSNCACVFCLDCIRAWRREGLTSDAVSPVASSHEYDQNGAPLFAT